MEKGELRIEVGIASGIDSTRSFPTREQQRSLVVHEGEDLRQELELDGPTHERLIEILIDERMQRARNRLVRPANVEQQAAEIVTTKLRAIRALLGDEGLDRYHDFIATRFERSTVCALDDRLAIPDKLVPEQRKRLIELLSEYSDRSNDPAQAHLLNISVPVDLDPEERRILGQLDGAILNEASLRRLREHNPALLARAAAFLSAAQLAELTRFREEGEAKLARFIEQQRAELDPVQVDAIRHRLVERLAPVPGDMTIELDITLDDRESVKASYTHPNGTPVTIELPEISVEVTATLLPHRALRLRAIYFGQLGSKRRQLDAPKSSGRFFGYLGNEPIGIVRTDVVHGWNRGHVVRTTVRVID